MYLISYSKSTFKKLLFFMPPKGINFNFYGIYWKLNVTFETLWTPSLISFFLNAMNICLSAADSLWETGSGIAFKIWTIHFCKLLLFGVEKSQFDIASPHGAQNGCKMEQEHALGLTLCASHFQGYIFEGPGGQDTRYCRGPKLYQLVIIGSAQP